MLLRPSTVGNSSRNCKEAPPSFTLLELLVVVGLMAILISMASFAFLGNKQDITTLQLGREFIAEKLNRVQALALKNAQRTRLAIFHSHVNPSGEQLLNIETGGLGRQGRYLMAHIYDEDKQTWVVASIEPLLLPEGVEVDFEKSHDDFLNDKQIDLVVWPETGSELENTYVKGNYLTFTFGKDGRTTKLGKIKKKNVQGNPYAVKLVPHSKSQDLTYIPRTSSGKDRIKLISVGKKYFEVSSHSRPNAHVGGYDFHGMPDPNGGYTKTSVPDMRGGYDASSNPQAWGPYDKEGFPDPHGGYDINGDPVAIGPYDIQGNLVGDNNGTSLTPIGGYNADGGKDPYGGYNEHGTADFRGGYDVDGNPAFGGQKSYAGVSDPYGGYNEHGWPEPVGPYDNKGNLAGYAPVPPALRPFGGYAFYGVKNKDVWGGYSRSGKPDTRGGYDADGNPALGGQLNILGRPDPFGGYIRDSRGITLSPRGLYNADGTFVGGQIPNNGRGVFWEAWNADYDLFATNKYFEPPFNEEALYLSLGGKLDTNTTARKCLKYAAAWKDITGNIYAYYADATAKLQVFQWYDASNNYLYRIVLDKDAMDKPLPATDSNIPAFVASFVEIHERVDDSNLNMKFPTVGRDDFIFPAHKNPVFSNIEEVRAHLTSHFSNLFFTASPNTQGSLDIHLGLAPKLKELAAVPSILLSWSIGGATGFHYEIGTLLVYFGVLELDNHTVRKLVATERPKRSVPTFSITLKARDEGTAKKDEAALGFLTTAQGSLLYFESHAELEGLKSTFSTSPSPPLSSETTP